MESCGQHRDEEVGSGRLARMLRLPELVSSLVRRDSDSAGPVGLLKGFNETAQVNH